MSEIKVLGYVRVSTDVQEENTSLTSQKRSIRDYCKSRGWSLIDIYEDTSTGSNLDREGFRKMEKDLDENGFNGVVVHKIDRLSRSIVDGSTYVKKLFEKDKWLVSISENIDTSQPQGKLFYNLLLVFGENEREVIRDRMMSGKRELVKEGKLPSSYIYGFVRDDDGNFKIVEDETKILGEMFDLYVEYESLGRVEKEFKNRGYKTRGGNNFTRQTIQNLLKNPVYTGKGFRWKGEIIEGNNIPRVVTTNKFNKVGKILNSRSRKIGGK